jgi:hypothetical protein
MTLQVYGYTRAEFLGVTLRDLYPAEEMLALHRNLTALAYAPAAAAPYHIGLWQHCMRATPPSAGRRWQHPQDTPVATVGEKVEQSVRPLPHIADTLAQVAEVPLFSCDLAIIESQPHQESRP